MATQSEAMLENELLKQLVSLGYEHITIPDEGRLRTNLKNQLEKHNNIKISTNEFPRITTHLKKGNFFEKAKILRDKFALVRDDASTKYIEFLDVENWCQNQFQVAHQISMEGSYRNRYDVTILINGLPLVQIELKRRGVELKQAFHQIERYHRHSYHANSALFSYIQIFVISNGINTKYYAHNRKQSFKQTFFWTDKDNNIISNLEQFTDNFLKPCHLSKMICKYIVLAETKKELMVLRPYQYYATEMIIDRVMNSQKNGYIWHTTGSGKTLTSFKASQLLMNLPQVHKVVFVVDRRDLDYQTTQEFNNFSNGSVDGTENTKQLIRQFGDDTKLIVTTIQKLNKAISWKGYLQEMQGSKNQHIVFIFDECHRSQFGETHTKISRFFTHNQMIGFTGTPIFVENALNKMQTTATLFHDCLHKYIISDAIRDENVLRFLVEYWGKFVQKGRIVDSEVEDIDTKEVLESHDRLDKITDHIIDHHANKTHNRHFNALFAIHSIDLLTRYYELFRSKHEHAMDGGHQLKIAAIFSYDSNDEIGDAEYTGMGSWSGAHVNEHPRDRLERYIQEYNKLFGTNYTTKDSQSFNNYHNDVSRRLRNNEIDILLVVGMFLTGFDSQKLNTLYIDKKLSHHGLIQACSRTNRIDREIKSHGNIVSFRNLKQAMDDAITLFSNKDAKESVLVEDYEEYINQFKDAYDSLMAITPDVQSVDTLADEQQQRAFIIAFRELLRLKNILAFFNDFSFDDLPMDEQLLADYTSKYRDLYDQIKSNAKPDKDSIIDEVDFELALLQRDEINLTYILQLLMQYRLSQPNNHDKQRDHIMNIMAGQRHLRSKRELVNMFIDSQLMGISGQIDMEKFKEKWDDFVQKEEKVALNELCKQENLSKDDVQGIISKYLYDQHPPLDQNIVDAIQIPLKLSERQATIQRVLDKIMTHIDMFYDL